MNKSIKYSFMALSTVFVLGFSACTEECDYVPAQQVNADCIKASFVSDGEQNIIDANSEKKVTITVNRQKTVIEHTTRLKALSTNDSHFIIPESVTFAAGANTATFDIIFSDVEAEEYYTYSVALDEADIDSYSESTIANTTGSVLQQAYWDTPIGVGEFTLSGLGAVLPCEVLQTSEASTWFKAVAPAAEGNDIIFKVNADNSVRMRETPVCLVNVGLPEPQMLYININPTYGGSYNPDTRTITVVLDYTCSAGPLGTFQDTFTLPASK